MRLFRFATVLALGFVLAACDSPEETAPEEVAAPEPTAEPDPEPIPPDPTGARRWDGSAVPLEDRFGGRRGEVVGDVAVGGDQPGLRPQAHEEPCQPRLPSARGAVPATGLR